VPEDKPEESAFIRITNREIWDSLQSLEHAIASMDNRMNNILGENVELRTRVRSLELKTYTIMAGFSTALVAAGLVLLKGLAG